MSADVVCMSLANVPPGEQRSRFLAVGLVDNTVRIISLDPSVWTEKSQHNTNIHFQSVPMPQTYFARVFCYLVETLSCIQIKIKNQHVVKPKQLRQLTEIIWCQKLVWLLHWSIKKNGYIDLLQSSGKVHITVYFHQVYDYYQNFFLSNRKQQGEDQVLCAN